MTDRLSKYNPLSLSQSEEVAVPPFFEEDGFVLHNDDCTKVMAGLPENSIDMIFADPPYKMTQIEIRNKGEPLVDSFRDFAPEVYRLEEKLIKLKRERI